jgi:predicted amidohydrolase
MQLILVQPELSFDVAADNPGAIDRLLAPLQGQLEPHDILLLPEHYDLRPSRADYERGVTALARRLGCHVVGGSHHEDRGDQRVNAGVVADADGQLIAVYEKVRPYAEERSRVGGGSQRGEVSIGGKRVLVLVCADFWFSDLFHRTTQLPDLVLVPAHSVTRKPAPDYSRALWRHLTIARAYEFGVYVGVSDWEHTPVTIGLPASGVAGFADPTRVEPEAFFQPIAGPLRRYTLDFDALDAFRRDRLKRGFFWRLPT